MVEQGIRLAQIDSTCRLLAKLVHAYRQTVTEDFVSNELQDLMVRYMLGKVIRFLLRPSTRCHVFLLLFLYH